MTNAATTTGDGNPVGSTLKPCIPGELSETELWTSEALSAPRSASMELVLQGVGIGWAQGTVASPPPFPPCSFARPLDF